MSKQQKCFGCYQPLDPNRQSENYHATCSKKLFGTENPPLIDFGAEQLTEMAKSSLSHLLGITGVQPKISVDLEKHQGDPKHRFMIAGLWGNFILKPPTDQFPEMSVVEDATMHMAGLAGITTARHGLIQLKSGELAYVTKRFDRDKNKKKIAMEDFCQLSELLTESKYDTSTEKAGKIVLKYSSNSGLDAISFFDINIFSFLTGNADMHLKNFSLIKNEANENVLSPAYDLLSTTLLLPEDKEEMALTVNGKKAKLKKTDFIALGRNLEIPNRAIENSFQRICDAIPQMKTLVQNSFLSSGFKKKYVELIDRRAKVLNS
jgi:serine/threonine-protein kinase HipA